MGEAKRRGTLEQRIEQAKVRKASEEWKRVAEAEERRREREEKMETDTAAVAKAAMLAGLMTMAYSNKIPGCK